MENVVSAVVTALQCYGSGSDPYSIEQCIRIQADQTWPQKRGKKLSLKRLTVLCGGLRRIIWLFWPNKFPIKSLTSFVIVHVSRSGSGSGFRPNTGIRTRIQNYTDRKHCRLVLHNLITTVEYLHVLYGTYVWPRGCWQWSWRLEPHFRSNPSSYFPNRRLLSEKNKKQNYL